MTVQEQNRLLGKIDFNKTNSFSQAFLDYIDQKKELEGFYNNYPRIEAFADQIRQRNFSTTTRLVLSKVLNSQYEGFNPTDLTIANIDSLKSEKTFTITTGHQLNIFTGPLYFIYKIVTAINACKTLKRSYPEYDFVPVYWMASEDHDFDEINHFRFQGEKFTWDTDQTGAVGRFDTKTIKSIFEKISMPDFFKKAYLDHSTLAEAVRYYVNSLFGDEGLVIIDADNPHLKEILRPVMEEDILKNTPNALVNQSNSELEALGYKTQVFPREINFFYLKGDLRSRIVRDGQGFQVLDSEIQFSQEQLKNEISNHPERFSPNVVLRPLYEEIILPNLAYVGGPSELLYWFQLKSVFDHFGTTFPILLPRNFAGVITTNIERKIKKEELSFEQIFLSEEDLIKELVRANTANNLELKSEIERIGAVFSTVENQAMVVDSTLEKLVKAEKRRAEKSLERIEKKLMRAEKKNQETLVNRIHDIKNALFPNGSPQERKDNFLNFYLSDPSFISTCLESFDPFDLRFHLIKANE